VLLTGVRGHRGVRRPWGSREGYGRVVGAQGAGGRGSGGCGGV